MATVNKIDSNLTGGLRIAAEETLGVLPATPVWKPYEPNSYNGFGGNISLMARNPINPSRQRKKGVVTDLDASGGWNHDFLQDSLQDIMEGVFFASFRRKAEFGGASEITAIDGTSEQYEAASGLGVFLEGALVLASGNTVAANNGLKRVTATSGTAITVAENLTAEASPAATSKLVEVGFQFASGDAVMDVTGTLPRITTTTKDCTDFGLVPGEWIFVGGDSAATKFATAACNGFMRVRSVAAGYIELDKSQAVLVGDAGTSKTVRIFFGRVLKNETGGDIVRRSFQQERQLGVPDTSNPSSFQAEYLVGCVPNTLTINIAEAGKVTVDVTFMGLDHEQVTATTGLKSGTRPTLVEEEAFNTSTDFSRIKMALTSSSNTLPSSLFAYLTALTFSINNNLSMNKAVGTLGAFDISAGTFEVGGSVSAYFADISAVAAVRNNSDVTIDAHLVKGNAGISIDIPLIALSDGRPDVVIDQPVKLPLTMAAATGASVSADMDHTASMVFFDYLPDLAA